MSVPGATVNRMDGLRLYLDTADLVTIGDRKQEVVVEELLRQCERLGVLLVVSMWHVADARNAPDDARARILDAIDRFPRRALARVEDEGIVLWSIASIRELTEQYADDVESINKFTNEAVNLEQSTERPSSPEWARNFGKRLLLESLGRAATKEEAIEIARIMLHKQRRRIAPEQAAQMIQGMDHAWAMRVQMEAAGLWSLEILTEALTAREVASVAVRNLGRHLGVLVDQRRRRQSDRAAQTGDLADRQHVHFAPYVDIFTGDHDICTWLVEWRTHVAYERAVEPITSRHLNLVATLLAEKADQQPASHEGIDVDRG